MLSDNFKGFPQSREQWGVIMWDIGRESNQEATRAQLQEFDPYILVFNFHLLFFSLTHNFALLEKVYILIYLRFYVCLEQAWWFLD